MIKISHVVFGESFGGVEGHICTLIKMLDGQQFSFFVICDPSVKEEFDRRLGDTNAQVRTITERSSTGLKRYGELVRIFGEISPDIVHNHLYSATRIAAPAAKKAGVPKVIETIHLEEVWRKGFNKAFFCTLDAVLGSFFVEGYIAVSDSVAQYYHKNKWVPEKKLTTIYNTTEHVPEKYQKRTFSYRLGFLGRLVPQKGLDVLLRAVKVLRDQQKSAELWIGGTGPLEHILKKLAHELDVQDSVEFLGQVEGPGKFFNEIDIFVLPSRYEGFPLVLLEAGMYRKPVVATHVSGNPEIIRDKQTGLLAEPESPYSLANAIAKFEDDDLRESCAVSLKELVETEFSRDSYKRRMSDYYKALVEPS